MQQTMDAFNATSLDGHPDTASQMIASLRDELQARAQQWLVEEFARLSQQAGRPLPQIPQVNHTEMVCRIIALELDASKLIRFITRYAGISRLYCISQGWLRADAPEQGAGVLLPEHRTGIGTQILTEAKDILFALLFGDATMRTAFDRTHRENLAITIPSHKLASLDYMQASSQYEVLGTWRDPEGRAHDVRARNTVMEIEYGETDDERIGDGILTCLRIINLLEVNEQVLYAKMHNVEQSTLEAV